MNNFIKGWFSRLVFYPIAELYEKRNITSKVRKLTSYYSIPFIDRQKIVHKRLVDTLFYAYENVPYYKSLFDEHNIKISNILKDIRYFYDIPILTKDIIRDNFDILTSTKFNRSDFSLMKSGGSTGPSAFTAYDSVALDNSAAVTTYVRGTIGKSRDKLELHFATQFPGHTPNFFNREKFKNLAMNRVNLLISTYDDSNMSIMLNKLYELKPFLVHGHPSTMIALALFAKKICKTHSAFKFFESSGEVLDSHQRILIEETFNCKVINRYGLSEFGIVAYQMSPTLPYMSILESEVFPESIKIDSDDAYSEILLTGLNNSAMPLIRYRTGDLGEVKINNHGYILDNVIGRVHDIVNIKGVPYPTNVIMDIIDHQIRGVSEFQIQLFADKVKICVVPESEFAKDRITHMFDLIWGGNVELEFVSINSFRKVGRLQKFRHVVNCD